MGQVRQGGGGAHCLAHRVRELSLLSRCTACADKPTCCLKLGGVVAHPPARNSSYSMQPVLRMSSASSSSRSSASPTWQTGKGICGCFKEWTTATADLQRDGVLTLVNSWAGTPQTISNHHLGGW